MYEYMIRNGVSATEIYQKYGVSPEISRYLKDEFGNEAYLGILRKPLNSSIRIRQRKLRGSKNVAIREIKVQIAIRSEH